MSTLNCESCGAGLEPSHLACPFCKAPTAFAREQHAREEQTRQSRAIAEAQAKVSYDAASRSNAQVEADGLARQSAIWGGIGVIFCCLPIPALVSLVLVYRARVIARKNGLVFPAMATVGLLLSVATLLCSASFYLFAGVSAVQKQQQIHALESAIASKASEETLDHDTACTLVQIQLLSHGFDGITDISDVKCDGALDQHGVVATLRDVTFNASTTFHTANASLRRGTRWVVERVTDASSPGPVPTANVTSVPTAPSLATPHATSSAHVPPHHPGAPVTPGAPSAGPSVTPPKPH